MSKYEPRYCSVPDLFGFREWFESNFKDVCKEHDMHYVMKDITMIQADTKAIHAISNIKPWFGAICLASYPLVLPVALWYWYIKN